MIIWGMRAFFARSEQHRYLAMTSRMHRCCRELDGSVALVAYEETGYVCDKSGLTPIQILQNKVNIF